MRTVGNQTVVRIVAAVVVLAIVVTAAFSHAAIARQMHAWKLLPEPERLTELYFTDPNHLPATYTPDQSQTVAFTVHNLEYATTTYHYQVTEQALTGGTPATLATGSFTLAQNEFARPLVNISLSDVGDRAKVTVKLTNQQESIDYLLSKSS